MEFHNMNKNNNVIVQENKMFREKINERDLLRASNLLKKRVRIPKVELNENPFCESRRMADEYQLQNFNKNPQYYSGLSILSDKNKTNYHNYSTLLNEKVRPKVPIKQIKDNVSEDNFTPRQQSEFPYLEIPHDFIKKIYDTKDKKLKELNPTIKLIQPRPSRLESITNFTSGMATRTVSFGHRPNSASRHYDPLTNDIKHSNTKDIKSGILNNKIGMSSISLHHLLNSTDESLTRKINATMTKSISPESIKKSKSSGNISEKKLLMNESLAQLENGFDNRIHHSKFNREKSVINAPDPTIGTGDLIKKYQKLAIGIQN